METVPHVRASLRLLPTSEGGRSHPIVGGKGSYRPNHNFFGPENRDMVMGFIDLPDGAVLEPGETAVVEIAFLNWEALKPDLHPGREWLVQEGANIVGVGTIIERLA